MSRAPPGSRFPPRRRRQPLLPRPTARRTAAGHRAGSSAARGGNSNGNANAAGASASASASGSFYIQVGAYSRAENASAAVRRKLRAAGLENVFTLAPDAHQPLAAGAHRSDRERAAVRRHHRTSERARISECAARTGLTVSRYTGGLVRSRDLQAHEILRPVRRLYARHALLLPLARSAAPHKHHAPAAPAATAAPAAAAAQPLGPGGIPTAPQVDARAYILTDYTSGQVLAQHNADARMEPASLTKLMTCYVVFHALKAGTLKLTDQVTISEHAWKAEGSRTFVQVGSQVPAEVLIKGMIVQSGNDATIALAERVGGTEAPSCS
jgi:hypothetical protein